MTRLEQYELLIKAIKEKISGGKITDSAIKAGLSEAFKGIEEAMIAKIKTGERFDFLGFANVKTVQTAERKGRNPSTGAEIVIPAKTKIVMKPSKALKDSLNK